MCMVQRALEYSLPLSVSPSLELVYAVIFIVVVISKTRPFFIVVLFTTAFIQKILIVTLIT